MVVCSLHQPLRPLFHVAFSFQNLQDFFILQHSGQAIRAQKHPVFSFQRNQKQIHLQIILYAYGTGNDVAIRMDPRLFPTDSAKAHHFLYQGMILGNLTDADIICKDDILPLWHTDLQGRVLGAVRDWGEDRSCGRIGLKNGRYFNSGVLLMDLVKWRQQKLTQKLFRWLEQVGNTKILWGDQDALNGVIDGWFTELPKIYNGIVINNTTLNEELDVVLVHYIDYIKPWHIYYMDSGAKELYWEYVKKSLWSDLRPVDGKSVQTVMMTARLLYKQGKYAESASYYEALLKYFLKDKYE